MSFVVDHSGRLFTGKCSLKDLVQNEDATWKHRVWPLNCYVDAPNCASDTAMFTPLLCCMY